MQGCHRKFGPNVALGAALEMFFFKFLIGPRMVLATVQQMPSGFAGMLDCLVLCFWHARTGTVAPLGFWNPSRKDLSHSGTSGFLEPLREKI